MLQPEVSDPAAAARIQTRSVAREAARSSDPAAAIAEEPHDPMVHSSMAELLAKVGALEDRQQAKYAEHSALQATLAALGQQKTELQSTVATLGQQKTELQEEVTQLQAGFMSVGKRVTTQNTDTEKLRRTEGQVAAVEATAARAVQKATQLGQRLESVREESENRSQLTAWQAEEALRASLKSDIVIHRMAGAAGSSLTALVQHRLLQAAVPSQVKVTDAWVMGTQCSACDARGPPQLVSAPPAP